MLENRTLSGGKGHVIMKEKQNETREGVEIPSWVKEQMKTRSIEHEKKKENKI